MARRAGKPLAPTSAFWYASAGSSLCPKGITPSVVSLHKRYPAVVWATPLRSPGALARLVRTREISSGDWAKAREVAVALADEWSVIQPSNGLRANAAQLVDRYDLPAAEALQLAAALQ
ncbi:MAG: hypothetical protein WCA20_22430 [Candidatus Sulfotelmatobacter sp.]